MKEIWKDIPFYEGIYEASSFGRIRSKEGKVTYSELHGKRVWKSRIIKNKQKKVNPQTGYRVTLWKDKRPKDWLVARLCCLAFHGIPENFELKNTGKRVTVNHKDGNRLNNHISNLEWMTLEENIKHGFDNGLYSSSKITKLTNLNTGEELEFNSMSKASLHMGYNFRYISEKTKKHHQFQNKEWKWEVIKRIKE